MTIEQILNAAYSDIVRNINRGTFTGMTAPDDPSWEGENFYTITSLYSQWAVNVTEAEQALWAMYEEQFGQFLIEI